MGIIIRTFFLFLSLKIICGKKFSVFPNSANVVHGEGLVMTVLPKDEPLKTCFAKGTTFSLNFTESLNNTFQNVTYWGRGLKYGDCGVQILNFEAEYEGKWRFFISTENENEQQIFADVHMRDPPREPTPAEISTSLGKPLTINCSSTDALQCKLLDPAGDMSVYASKNSCVAEIQSVKMRDIGIWKCYTTLNGRAQEVVTEYNITAEPIENIEFGSSKSELTYNLYCNLLTNNEISYCEFERPDGKSFVLLAGTTTGKYTYYGEGISEKNCGISIQLPLDEEDKGTWKCRIHSTNGKQTGAFINLGDTSEGNLSSFKGTKTVMLANGTELSLKCSIKGSIRYCWFLHPNGTRYAPHPEVTESSYEYYGDGLELGDCGIKISTTNISDSGLWTCGMGINVDEGFSQDVQMKISVLVSESRIVPNRTTTFAHEGDWAILGCRSLLGEGLEYCSFVAPNGTGYSLTSSAQKSGHPRFSYYGNGLENGHCGLLINPVKAEDYGIWKCAAMLTDYGDNSEYYQNLILNGPGFTTSSAVGIGVGIGVAVIIALGAVIWRQRKFNEGNIAPSEIRQSTLSRVSEDSGSSEEIEMSVQRRIIETGV